MTNLLESTSIKTEATIVPIFNEESLMEECERLGKEIGKSQQEFGLAIRTSIERACEIGRIASAAKECISKLPTKAEKAKLLKISIDKLNYKKPTFEQWIETHTGLGKNTVYSMMKLYEISVKNPDRELPEDMGWRESLGYFSEKQKIKKVEDGEDKVEDQGEESDPKFELERKEFNKVYEKVDKIFAKFLDGSDNIELKERIAKWKNIMSEDLSEVNLPFD